jgi:malonyl-CoA/methylmalonyl-CoA synthetase
LGCPYIGEAVAIGVLDKEFGQSIEALVSLQDEELTDTFLVSHGGELYVFTIEAVRKDLRARLAGYMTPSLLRLVNGELPKTAPSKVQKVVLGPRNSPKRSTRGATW